MSKTPQQPKPRKELIAASQTTKLPEKERSFFDIPFNAAAANSGNYNYEQGRRDWNEYHAALN